jgi:NNP family nitrate/nitrite transporter-like MFS transporter
MVLKATKLWSHFFSFSTPQMRAFHMSWLAFFLCFFAWFGIAPLMPVIRQELGLTKSQVGWCVIASVAITILARVMIGAICDRIGPRLAFSGLLVLGALPVMGIGLAHGYETFLLFRLMIGAIGASFVITQYHTSLMFAPNVIGAASATAAGWGNLGGGVTQFVMPLVYSLFVGVIGVSSAWGWRLSMLVAGALCFATGIAYYCLTQDTPEGNFRDLRAVGKMPPSRKVKGSFGIAARDSRVWVLFLLYAASFGVELTMTNIAALYFTDNFKLGLKEAGFAAAAYGLMNIFSRTCGGLLSDRCGQRWGLEGRVSWLFAVLFCEGLALLLFSQMSLIGPAIAALMGLGLFAQMANGANFAVVPFVNKRCLGSIAGIVGAGGNVGAVAAGFLFQGAMPWPSALFTLGVIVTAFSFLSFTVRFSLDHETEARSELEAALVVRHAAQAQPALT